MSKSQELKLHKYLKKNPITISNKKASFLDHEVSVHKAHYVFTKEITYTPVDDENEVSIEKYRENLKGSFGRIDTILYYRTSTYCCEIKGTQSPNQFFDALKVLGYTAYYNWENSAHAKPAIIMPFEHITIEHQIMSGKLNILLIGYKLDGEHYKLTEIGDTPIWKQHI